MEISSVIQAVEDFAKLRIAVFGDYALDKYLYIDPERDELSVETGLVAYQVDKKSLSPGIGGCTINNLRALGINAVSIGLMGNDGEGYELIRCLERTGADVSHFVTSATSATCTYIKPMRRDAQGGYAEMSRIDLRNFMKISRGDEDSLLSELRSVLGEVDAVIITDQYFQRNTGVLTDRVRAELCGIAHGAVDVIFYVDSRSFLSEYRGMVMKCNNHEFVKTFCGSEGDEKDVSFLAREGARVRDRYSKPLFITCGEQGMLALDESVFFVPTHRVDPPIDIVGAGEASNAALVTGLSLGLRAWQAAVLACCVSSITIQQIGTTGTASIPQLTERLESYSRNFASGIRKMAV